MTIRKRHLYVDEPDKVAIVDFVGNYSIKLELQPNGKLWVEVMAAEQAKVVLDTIVGETI